MSTTDIYSRDVRLCNARGLHARASARFVTLAAQFDAEISVHKDDDVVLATSIMGLMMLTASAGDVLVLRATGVAAQAAVDALATLVEDGFGEET